MAQVEFEQVSFAYPGAAARALNDVCLRVERGAFVLLCGPSGSGKTTLLQHLVPALAPHGERSGRVLIDGRPVGELGPAEAAARVAYVAQDPAAQLVCDRVWHELAFGLENLGTPQPQMRARVAEMASYLGIGSWFHRDVSELSGGQKQLLGLAAAMVLQPQVLVLDEPTAQLDPIAAGEFLATVRRLNEELGVTVVMTEHRLEEVYPLASQVVLLRDGRVQACGSPRDVARDLLASGDQMALALPTPARVWGAASGLPAQPSNPARPAAGASELAGAACPLTVREGRAWLAGVLGEGGRGFSAVFGSEPASPCAEPALRLRDVWFRYEREGADVLRGASLEVRPGELYALVGANGAGKSTLLRAACGVCAAQRGRVEVLGRDLRSYRGRELFAHGLAMLPQDPASLFVHDTVRAELLEMLPAQPIHPAHPDARESERRGLLGCLRAWGASRGEGGAQACATLADADLDSCDPAPATLTSDARIAQVAELCGVAELLGRHPRDLSGGEQQRVALAKVLLTEPRVVLLDEPTKGLDAAAKLELAGLLAELCGQGVAVLAVSHDVEFCAEHATRVGLLFDGEVVSEGAPREFFAANAFYTTAARRMARGLLEGAVTAGDLAVACRATGKQDGAL